MNMTTHPAWYAVSVRSNFERIVAHSLSAKGYEIFFPSYVATRRWSDRTRSLERPLFPGYLFCRMQLDRRVPLLNTGGVAAILGVGRCPLPLSDSEIQAIQRIVESGLPAEPCPFLQAGQRVRIRCGPLAGIEGIVAGARNRTRLVVSVEMLRRSVTVEIEQAWAEPAGRSCAA